MAEITASLVAKLRAKTGAGLMDCKKALVECGGDVEAAIDGLRKKGIASAAKKASRSTHEGRIAQYVNSEGRLGAMVEVNCETDFVAKNDSFKSFCDEAAKGLAVDPNRDLEELRTNQVAKIGENITLTRHKRIEVNSLGLIVTYIHPGDKIGVMIEVCVEKEESLGEAALRQLAHDLTLQVAAASPVVVTRDELAPSMIERERAIAQEQAKGKPPHAIDKIVSGKLEKYFQTACLVDQAFIKDGNRSVKEYVSGVGKSLEDQITVRQFVRFQVGETVED